MIERTGWAGGERVLDVGCGAGTLLEEGVRAGVEMVGVDVSTAMVEAARERVPAARLVEADAQTTDLLAAAPGTPFDRVVSRFGVMFFSDPVAAFANLRRASRPGATLTFVCWRSREANPVFSQGSEILAAALPEPPPSTPPGAPGPTAFADPDRLRTILDGAGWGEAEVEPFDFSCDYGVDGSDGVEERLAVILSSNGRVAWEQLQATVGEERQAELLDEVRADLRSRRVDGVVRIPAATWLVAARNPAADG
nr:class I SAM-dependent methyltransferase [Ornithinimicrobium sp. F0845]